MNKLSIVDPRMEGSKIRRIRKPVFDMKKNDAIAKAKNAENAKNEEIRLLALKLEKEAKDKTDNEEKIRLEEEAKNNPPIIEPVTFQETKKPVMFDPSAGTQKTKLKK